MDLVSALFLSASLHRDLPQAFVRDTICYFPATRYNTHAAPMRVVGCHEPRHTPPLPIKGPLAILNGRGEGRKEKKRGWLLEEKKRAKKKKEFGWQEV